MVSPRNDNQSPHIDTDHPYRVAAMNRWTIAERFEGMAFNPYRSRRQQFRVSDSVDSNQLLGITKSCGVGPLIGLSFGDFPQDFFPQSCFRPKMKKGHEQDRDRGKKEDQKGKTGGKAVSKTEEHRSQSSSDPCHQKHRSRWDDDVQKDQDDRNQKKKRGDGDRCQAENLPEQQMDRNCESLALFSYKNPRPVPDLRDIAARVGLMSL